MDEPTSGIDLFPRRQLARKDGPLYQQVADLIRSLISRGLLKVGSELPKEAQIEDRFEVSLITVRRALRELEEAGLIRKRSAKPAVVVAQNPKVAGGWKFKNFIDLTNFTKDAVLVVVSYKQESGPEFQKYLDMPEGESGYCLRGYLAVGDKRKTAITTFFPPDIGSQLSIPDFTDALIFRTVERCLGLKIDYALAVARAEIAKADDARDLDVAIGSPMLTIEMLYHTNDHHNVEFTIARNPAELFNLSLDISLTDSQ